MNKLNHLKTFEQHSFTSEDDLNEGLFTSLKTDISKFLEKTPDDEEKADNLIKKAFVTSFSGKAAKATKIKEKVLELPMAEKVRILKDSVKKLEDKKIGNLKIVKGSNGKFAVGGANAAFSVG